MLEVGTVERVELPQLRLVEQPLDLVHLARTDLEPLDQPLAHVARRRARELEPDDVAEPAPSELGLDRFQEVVGVVGQLEVGVAGDAEERPLGDLHPREQHRQEVRDDGLQRYEALAHGHEPVEALGHLDAREALLAALGVRCDHAQRERQAGDVRERLAGSDREGRQDRKDLALEVPAELLLLALGALVDRRDLDAGLGERRAELALPQAPLPRDQLPDPHPDRLERLPGGESVDGALGHVRLGELEQAGDPDHEELVEVPREDRRELDPLEQRQPVVLRELEDARVELDPGELAVEQSRRGGLGDGRHGRMVP